MLQVFLDERILAGMEVKKPSFAGAMYDTKIKSLLR
jgi:hypothetical protein